MGVEGEEEFDAGAVVGEGGGAVGAVNGAVEFVVGFDEFGGHGQRVVEVGERAGRVFGAGVEDGLGAFPNGGAAFFIRFRPREVVVHEFVGVLKSRFQAASY